MAVKCSGVFNFLIMKLTTYGYINSSLDDIPIVIDSNDIEHIEAHKVKDENRPAELWFITLTIFMKNGDVINTSTSTLTSNIECWVHPEDFENK